MTRRLSEEEGMFVGGSCGMVMAGALRWLADHQSELKPTDVAVVLLPDSGFRYLGKIFNDEWMRENGFLERVPEASAAQVLDRREHAGSLITVSPDDSVELAVAVMAQNGISQVPVFDGEEMVGSLSESFVLSLLLQSPEAKARLVTDVMGDPFPVVDSSAAIGELASLLKSDCGAVLVRDEADGTLQVLTQTDLIGALTAR